MSPRMNGLRAELDRPLQFETLLADLSARFINLPSEEVDREIEASQRRICERLGLDGSTLCQRPVDAPEAFLLTHAHQQAGAPPLPMHTDANILCPWLLNQVRRGDTVALSSLEDLPAEAARDKEVLSRHGTKSTVVIPLSTGGAVIGALIFATMHEHREWPETLVKRLQLVAQVFSNAIARARYDQALRNNEARLRLAAESAGAGLWVLDYATNHIWATEKARELFGLNTGEELAFEEFIRRVHPDDRPAVFQTMPQIPPAGEIRLEFRILLPDGRVRWISVRGCPQLNLAAQATRLMGASIDITERKEAEEHLRRSLEEVQRLRDQLKQQNVYLRQEVKLLHRHGRLVSRSQTLQRVLMQVEQVAETGSTVLLLGETGTGKEVVALTIHEASPRRDHVMVRVNCSAIPATLIESELFGREKGAYTGALSRQIGRFEMANGSTLFLDEIGDLPPEVQIKLLRVLQERQIERLGSPKPIDVDVRIVAATNQDLEAAVREGRFRQDLYYRLNVFPVRVPPLRERREDISSLVSAFVNEFSAAFGKNIESIDRGSMEALQRYDWPGNVRELRNVIERAMIVAAGPNLRIELPVEATPSSTPSLSLRRVDRDHITRVLEMTNWRIRGRNGAAEILAMKPTTLESRIAKLGLHRPGGHRDPNPSSASRWEAAQTGTLIHGRNA
jgi:formate hydrogenlyase transcriptional activator